MIDERAIIDPNAHIEDDVTIGPWTIIGPEVKIGRGTTIGSHVVIQGATTIGRNNKIHQFASIGEAPQHLNYKGENTCLQIGDGNIIREFCTLNKGTAQGGGVTAIGDHNFLMAYVHIAHDCIVGNHTIFVNNASLAGHVTVKDFATIGGFVGIHQFCNVGAYSFVTAAALVGKDVPPYVIVSGNKAKAAVCGLNSVGLKRRGFTAESITMLRRAYQVLFRRGLGIKQALAALEEMVSECPEVQLFIDAVNGANRGLLR